MVLRWGLKIKNRVIHLALMGSTKKSVTNFHKKITIAFMQYFPVGQALSHTLSFRLGYTEFEMMNLYPNTDTLHV